MYVLNQLQLTVDGRTHDGDANAPCCCDCAYGGTICMAVRRLRAVRTIPAADRFAIRDCWLSDDEFMEILVIVLAHTTTKQLTQQRDEWQFGDVKVIRCTGVLQSTGRCSHLDFSHMHVTTIEHHAHEARLTMQRNCAMGLIVWIH